MRKTNRKKISIIILAAAAVMAMQTSVLADSGSNLFASAGAGSLVAIRRVVKPVNEDYVFSEILTDHERSAPQGEQADEQEPAEAEESIEDTDKESSTEARTTAYLPREAGQSSISIIPSGLYEEELTAEDLDEQEDAEEEEAGTLYGYTNLGIVQVDDHLNVRATAEEDSRIVGKMEGDSGCEILEIEGDRAHITSGSVEGYVSTAYILTGQAALDRAAQVEQLQATVTADGLKIREEPSTDARVITMVAYGEEMQVLDQLDGWVAIKYDGQKAYVCADYVSISRKLKTALNITEFLYGAGVSNVRLSLCEYAKKFIGNPYVWGGESLTKGADCSGFVLSVYKKYGIVLPHSSRAQANCGRSISLSEAKPGDLVFYAKGKRINHVGIYIGGGQIVNASSPRTGIRIANVYYRKPVKVVRILND